MPSIRPENLTAFGRIALKLDEELSELARAGEQISRVDIESDGGLDEGVKILKRVAQCGQSVAETMQEFSKSLQEARDKAEAATKLVAERAQRIQQRRQQQDRLEERLAQMKEDVKAAGASLAGFNKPGGGAPSDEDKRRIAAELERLQEPMNEVGDSSPLSAVTRLMGTKAAPLPGLIKGRFSARRSPPSHSSGARDKNRLIRARPCRPDHAGQSPEGQA